MDKIEQALLDWHGSKVKNKFSMGGNIGPRYGTAATLLQDISF